MPPGVPGPFMAAGDLAAAAIPSSLLHHLASLSFSAPVSWGGVRCRKFVASGYVCAAVRFFSICLQKYTSVCVDINFN